MARRLSAMQQFVATRTAVLRLQGPLADEPAARTLHILLIGMLVWSALHGALVLLRVTARPAAAAGLLTYQAATCGMALIFLRRGAFRKAATAYLAGVCVTATVVISLNGGIFSPLLALYAAIPISAAWLLGYRASLILSAACLLYPLGMAIAEMMGRPLPRYFTGTPLAVWSVFLLAFLIAALPVMMVLRALHQSLAAAQRWIAELRETQEELGRERDLVNRIMETSPVGIMAVDREGRISFVNSSGERILGLSREEATKRSYDDPVWSTTTQEGRPYPNPDYPFRQVQLHGTPVHDVRLSIARPDGRRVLLAINAAPVLTAEGRFDGMVAALADMTERARVDGELRKYRERLEDLVRQRTEELEAARDQAMAANQAKSAFLANMSHELRTPLNAILGFAGLLADSSNLPEKDLAKAHIIQRSGSHLLDLINDLLDMAKIETGGVTVERTTVDLHDLVFGVMEMMRIRAEEKGLRLNVDRSPAFPRHARTDGPKIGQILINLLSNAIKYTQEGQVVLRLDAASESGLLLQFEVADTGPGIAAEDQERIFGRFIRAGSRAGGGAGLGLAITRQYVQLMGGSIEVESAPGGGSRFRVMLPAETVDADAVSTMQSEGEGIVASVAPGQPACRVLIVEDQEENRLLLRQLIAGAGFQTQVAGDGAAAVAAFQSWQPHFIWMDWRLPVMDGESVTKTIRATDTGRGVKIAAVTASVFPEDRAAILAAGVDDYVRKPFRPSDIFSCMSRLLGVQYVYRRSDSPPSKPEGTLTPAILRRLPEDLRDELERALLSLDAGRIASAIHRASEADPEAGSLLSRRADALGYTAILQALDGSREPVGREAK